MCRKQKLCISKKKKKKHVNSQHNFKYHFKTMPLQCKIHKKHTACISKKTTKDSIRSLYLRWINSITVSQTPCHKLWLVRLGNSIYIAPLNWKETQHAFTRDYYRLHPINMSKMNKLHHSLTNSNFTNCDYS